MVTALYILHVIVCLAMLPIILLQSGKGGGVSAVFGGGGGGSAMSSRGASNFLTRMTTGAAIVFMCTSLALSVVSSRPGSVVSGSSGSVVGAQAPDDGEKATESLPADALPVDATPPADEPAPAGADPAPQAGDGAPTGLPNLEVNIGGPAPTEGESAGMVE